MHQTGIEFGDNHELNIEIEALRLPKSLVNWMFTQKLFQANNKETLKVCITDPWVAIQW